MSRPAAARAPAAARGKRGQHARARQAGHDLNARPSSPDSTSSIVGRALGWYSMHRSPRICGAGGSWVRVARAAAADGKERQQQPGAGPAPPPGDPSPAALLPAPPRPGGAPAGGAASAAGTRACCWRPRGGAPPSASCPPTRACGAEQSRGGEPVRGMASWSARLACGLGSLADGGPAPGPHVQRQASRQRTQQRRGGRGRPAVPDSSTGGSTAHLPQYISQVITPKAYTSAALVRMPSVMSSGGLQQGRGRAGESSVGCLHGALPGARACMHACVRACMHAAQRSRADAGRSKLDGV